VVDMKQQVEEDTIFKMLEEEIQTNEVSQINLRSTTISFYTK